MPAFFIYFVDYRHAKCTNYQSSPFQKKFKKEHDLFKILFPFQKLFTQDLCPFKSILALKCPKFLYKFWFHCIFFSVNFCNYSQGV